MSVIGKSIETESRLMIALGWEWSEVGIESDY